MTTTITVKTHSWPVRATTEQNHSYRDEATGRFGHGYQTSSDVVPKDSERSYSISQGGHATFVELPEDWTPESEADHGALNRAGAASARRIG